MKIHLTKKNFLKKIIRYLIKNKIDIKEIEQDLDYYINNSKKNGSINITKLLNCLEYNYTLINESKHNINNFIQFLFMKYNTPQDLSVTYTISSKLK